ncbi:protein of unknown function [Chitinophaga sp. CF118]|uniref:DUF4836 family protein n=1 Tax=Chitinophaga sp. CF118 TaxID=1884367 RepID=UPI0008ED4A85|nr:DUF4836 family protein [Chitinophaga sp. CF118]SFE69669.1 protein of unknown function [Chitinophaga sp. CF118]
MRKNISKVLLTAVTAAVVFSACSKLPEQSKYIPKTAGVVLSINSKQISKKLVTNGITMDKMFAAVQDKDTSNPAMKAWKDAENSGIDLQGNFFVSVVFNSSEQSYVSMTGGLKDAGKFEEYLKKNIPNFSLKKKNDFQYVWQEDQKAVIGWNKETVIYVRGVDTKDLKNKGMMPSDNPDSDSEEAAVADSAVAQPAALVTSDASSLEDTWVAEVDHLFHLKKDETAGTIDAFKDLLKDNADLSVYVNPEPIYTAQGSSISSMIPANLKNLIAGNFYTGSINFEKGKVVVEGSSYIGKDLAAIYKKYDSQDADLEMLEKYPSDNITGFLVYGFDFRIIGDIVKSTGLDGIANMGLHSSGLTLDDILNAFKGQMVFAASDFSVSKKPNPYFPEDSITKSDAKWIFAMKVGDKAAFDKVMTSPMLKNMFTKQGDHYVMQEGMPGMPAVSITDKLVVTASDNAFLEQYQAGKGKAGGLDNSFISKIKGNPLGGYVNIEKIVNNIPDEEIPADSKELAGQVKNLLKDATILTNKFDGKIQHSEMVLNFKNENENSLVQLVNLGTSAAKYYKEHKEKEHQGWEGAAVPDTAAVPVQ